MQAFRRVASSSARNILANKRIFSNAGVRGLSSLTERERGEEARYFRQQEELRKAELRTQLEKILADEKHEQNDDLIEILEASKPAEKKSFTSRYHLDDWKVAVPLGLLVGIPLIEQEIIMMNEELYVGIGFFAFVAGFYHFGGDAVSKTLNDYKSDIATRLKQTEDGMIQQITEDIESNKEIIGVEKDIAEIHDLVDNLAVAQAEVLTQEAQHAFRDTIAKNLDTLAALEDSATYAIRTRMLKTVQSDVLTAFKNDKRAKEAALSQAVAVLTGGVDAKLGDDVVGKVFLTALKSYREDYAKKPAGSDEIITKLEKDVASLLEIPAVSGGGNVYETHPISPRFVA